MVVIVLVLTHNIMKLPNIQSDISIIKRAFILSAVYFLLFNSAVLQYKYSYYKGGSNSLALLELFKQSFYVYLMLFISFLGFSLNNILLRICSYFLYMSGAFVSYYIYAMKILPTKHIIKSVLDVEFTEAYELVSIKMMAWVILSLVICYYLLKKFEAKDTSNSIFRTILFIIFIVSIANIITPFYRVFNNYLPIQYLHNTYHYFLDRYSTKNKSNILAGREFLDKSAEDLVVVLVIGESARSDHFGVYGYERPTTPNLQNIQNIHFYKAIASSNMTYTSVVGMLSRYKAADLDDALNENTLLSIFTSLGFNTIWIGTQSITKYFRGQESSIYDEVNINIIPGGSALYALSSYDEVMIPYFENALSKPGKKLVVLHTSGSHWNYGARYPKHFAKFRPVCEELSGKRDHSSCGHEHLINSYDNSIYYTDNVLSAIIQKIQNENSFLLYISDHGESLGEGGFYGHGSAAVPHEQKNVPLIAWFSNKYIASHPGISYIPDDNILSHDNIFHSILDCSGIISDLIDKKLSICNKPIV